MIADKQFDYITDNHHVTAYVDYTDGKMIVVCNNCDSKHVIQSDDLDHLVDEIETGLINPFGTWEDGLGETVTCLCTIEVSEDDLPF